MKTKIMKKIYELREAECNLFLVFVRFLYYYLFFGRKILAHQKTRIRGIRNIEMFKDSWLYIGIRYRGFLTPNDWTLINVKGILILDGDVNIFRGARIDVDKHGVLKLGDKVGINSFTKIICANNIVIGEGTSIGWDCQILDTNFHSSGFMKGTSTGFPVTIGKNVFIGHHTMIENGAFIADGCSIRQNSIIEEKFTEPNKLIRTKRIVEGRINLIRKKENPEEK
jgi:acetyltransferase-like isoleucine patch superfamily enzyme